MHKVVTSRVEIQAHRGAKALRPENTLPAFEAAIDVGADSIETDLRATADNEIVLLHDDAINPSICVSEADESNWTMPGHAKLASLSRHQLKHYRVARNPDITRYPRQQADDTELCNWFVRENDDLRHSYSIPTLRHLFRFVQLYAGPVGKDLGKTFKQQATAQKVILDLEIKSSPSAERVSEQVLLTILKQIHDSGLSQRCRVRSFDDRVIRWWVEHDRSLEIGVLRAEGNQLDPVREVETLGATFYGPDFRILQAEQVKRFHQEGIRVLPWTVNEPDEWRKLIDWEVDGITTDDPEQLVNFVTAQSA